MKRAVFILCSTLAVAGTGISQQPDVRVEKSILQGPRVLQEQTQSAAIRNYLQAWESLAKAFDQNNAGALESDFTGTAKDRLSETIKQQAAQGIRTRYQDKSHDIQIVFYSPEGLSIELTDNVEYDLQVLSQEKVQTTQHIRARFIAVLTPAEVRWRVRLLQAQSE